MIDSNLTEPAAPHKQPKYPYLARLLDKRGDLIVLFTDEKSGIVVVADQVYTVGHQSKTWLECDFTPLATGSRVTLEQK